MRRLTKPMFLSLLVAVMPMGGVPQAQAPSADSPKASGQTPETERVGRVFKVGPHVSPPSVIHKVDPSYSEQARRAGLDGTVGLYVEIEPDGMPHNVQVRHSLGMGLDEKAMEAVQQWRFKPGMKEGHPVTVKALVTVNFRLIPGDGAEGKPFRRAETEPNAMKRLQLLDQWKKKYPDLRVKRMRLYVDAYEQAGDFAKAIGAANELLAVVPNDAVANYAIARHSPFLGACPRNADLPCATKT